MPGRRNRGKQTGSGTTGLGPGASFGPAAFLSPALVLAIAGLAAWGTVAAQVPVAGQVRAAAQVPVAAQPPFAARTEPAEPAHAGEHLHTPLEASEDLSWPELIDVTLENFPRFVELAARDAEANALVERSRSWLAAQPQLVVRYQSDRPWDDVNLEEREVGVELPLWRPGERRAAESLGAAAKGGSSAAATALRHEIIGMLRMSLWDIERAANELAVARDAARIAGELQAAIDRRFAAGEVPLSDTLLIRSSAMEREAAVIEAEALLVDAERAYQSLTGLDTKPTDFSEALTDREDFDDSHPLLRLAESEVEQALAAVELTRRSSKGNPSLTIGPADQRGAFSNYWARSVNLSVSMPFGGRAHSAAATAASSRAATQAEADRRQLLRELDLELHEAKHTLLVIEESLTLAEQRSELAAQGFAMSERAFAEGETTVLELLRSEEIALATQREVAGLEVERQRAIAQINQSIGVWP
jgi:outer membrane protein, heavy metal efflux system